MKEKPQDDAFTEPALTSAAAAESTPGLTSFSSNVPELDQVWELVRHTINAAALDLNTDSNTRQRDLCTLDAWVATRYQGGVAPGTASHLRRRVVQNMYEPNGYVNYWSEFLVAHVGALHDYTLEYADQDLAGRLWNQAPISMDALGLGKNPSLGMDNYSLLTYFNESDGLVHETPRPLVDWPRSSGLDTDEKTSGFCNKLCAQMNAYAAVTQGWMAEISKRAGISGKQASPAYSERAAKIRSTANTVFAASGSDCHPTISGPDDADATAAPLQCYRDQPAGADPEAGSVFTSATASSLAAFANLPGDASGVIALVPFLKARNGRRGPGHGMETSGWMTGFMLEGIYTAAGDLSDPALDPAAVLAAADYAHDTLTNEGNNSWLGMIRQNATMTMESWTQAPYEDEGGGTFSHPWTAAPAWVIPRFLMGVRPIEDGWRRIAIRPLPGSQLTKAAMTVLTPRGEVAVSFEKEALQGWALNLTVPGNTKAQVCVPRYLFAGMICGVTVSESNGGYQPVASSEKGALLCLDDGAISGSFRAFLVAGLASFLSADFVDNGTDLGGGSYAIEVECTDLI